MVFLGEVKGTSVCNLLLKLGLNFAGVCIANCSEFSQIAIEFHYQGMFKAVLNYKFCLFLMFAMQILLCLFWGQFSISLFRSKTCRQYD